MRILFVHQNLAGVDAESVEAKRTIEALLSQGHQVGILYRKTNGPAMTGTTSALADLGVEHLSFTSVKSAIAAFKPELGHIKSCWTPSHCSVAKALRAHRIPYILEPGGHLFDVLLSNRYGGRKASLLNIAAKHFYRVIFDRPMITGAAAVRALSAYEAAFVRERFAVPSFALSLGFDADWLTQGGLASREAISHPISFLFLGRLDTFQKSLDLILSASALLRDEGRTNQFTVTFAGPTLGDSAEKLSRKIQTEKLTNVNIEPAVYGPEKRSLFAKSHVFLHPSRFEEMAKLAREATAAGLPIIASRASNFGDWADEHQFGLITELTPFSLASRMSWFLDNPRLIHRMSRNAREYAESRNWPWVAQQLGKHYEHYVSSAE